MESFDAASQSSSIATPLGKMAHWSPCVECSYFADLQLSGSTSPYLLALKTSHSDEALSSLAQKHAKSTGRHADLQRQLEVCSIIRGSAWQANSNLMSWQESPLSAFLTPPAGQRRQSRDNFVANASFFSDSDSVATFQSSATPVRIFQSPSPRRGCIS